MTALTEWGPTLVILLAVFLSGLVALRISGARTRSVHYSFLSRGQSITALRVALKCAESINAYDVATLNNPHIHLGKVVRLAPTGYQDGAIEISGHFKDGQVVSVDLSLMHTDQAARLVDFCSGMLAGTSGWLFRATERVIVLTPRLS
jgi:FtsZ-interacting cell division protein YlmF